MSEPLSPRSQARLLSRQGLDHALQRDIENNAPPSETCSLGLDFGNYASKISIARKKGPKVQVYRVQLNVDFQDPESSNDHNDINNVYEFNSKAILVDGRLITGRQAMASRTALKQEFFLKTMFMYSAGITSKKILERAPGGRALLRAVENGDLTRDMMVRALEYHFSLLREQALRRSNLLRSKIDTVVVTVPNFFAGRENESDYANLRLFFLTLLDTVWEGYEVRFEIVSEGQAAALYICDSFQIEDSDCLFNREGLFQELQDLVVDGALNLKFFDSGGSTVNIQDLTAYYRPDGTISATQANIGRDSRRGALGGSNLSNSEVKHEIEELLQPGVEPEQLSEYMRKFEVWKWNVGDLKQDAALELVGTSRDKWVSIPAEIISDALDKSFGPGLDALTMETRRALAFKKNCAFIFCGGSYRNPGLRKKIQQKRDIFAEDFKKAGIHMKHIYLSNYDKTWVSAISVGAALSTLKVPHPLDVFQGSALGFHMHLKKSRRWIDSPRADVIFSQKWGQAPPVYFTIPARYKSARRLWLVCDPTYSESNREAPEKHRPIEIGPEEEVLNGPISTYQLDFMLTGFDMPSNQFAISTFGPDLGRLRAELTNCAPGPDHLTIGLHCYPIIDGRAEPDHKSARRWHVTMKTAASSKLLVVSKGICLPVTCSVPGCTKQLQTVHQCMICETHFVCDDCWAFNDEVTHRHHVFEKVTLAWAPANTPRDESSECDGTELGDDLGMGGVDDMDEFVKLDYEP